MVSDPKFGHLPLNPNLLSSEHHRNGLLLNKTLNIPVNVQFDVFSEGVNNIHLLVGQVVYGFLAKL